MGNSVLQKWGEFEKEIFITNELLCFLVHGKKGTVNFLMHLGIQEVEYNSSIMHCETKYSCGCPFAQDLGWHSKKPQYKYHQCFGSCGWCKEKECYYEGTCAGAGEMMHIFITEGTDAVFEKLRKHYLEYYKDQDK